MFSPLGLQNEPFDIDFYPSPKADPAKKITLMQDSVGMKDFFVREIQGEWMKLQECIDYGPLYAEDAIVDEEGWEKISKLSEQNPTYWIRWRRETRSSHPRRSSTLSTAAKRVANTSTHSKASPYLDHEAGKPSLFSCFCSTSSL